MDIAALPWTVDQTAGSITGEAETFEQNQNAKAIRWGTLYNFRFDADQPRQTANATPGFFKTGSPTTVEIQAPEGNGTNADNYSYQVTPRGIPDAERQSSPAVSPDAVAAGNVIGDQ